MTKTENALSIKTDVCYKFLWLSIHHHQWILKRNINKPQHASTPSSLLLKALRFSDELTHNIVLPIFLINFFLPSFLNHPRFSHSLPSHLIYVRIERISISLSVCEIPPTFDGSVYREL